MLHTIEKKKMEETVLPKGWKREEVIRKSGLSAGKTDIYYYGPDGKKYRSKPQIAKVLGEAYDMAAFDFRTGKMVSQSNIVRQAKSKRAFDLTKGQRGEINLSLPVRQTASIFKQPVTVIRSHPDSEVRHDLKHGSPDSVPPKQLFWERALSGLMCSSIDEEALESIDLPSKIQGIGVDWTTENLLQSIAAALHLNVQPVVGQSQPPAKFMKSPTVHVNTNQPIIQRVVVTDEDIQQQETKVDLARKRLRDLLRAIEESNLELENADLKDKENMPVEDQDDIESMSEPAFEAEKVTPETGRATPEAENVTPEASEADPSDLTTSDAAVASDIVEDQPQAKRQKVDNDNDENTSEDISSLEPDSRADNPTSEADDNIADLEEPESQPSPNPTPNIDTDSKPTEIASVIQTEPSKEMDTD